MPTNFVAGGEKHSQRHRLRGRSNGTLETQAGCRKGSKRIKWKFLFFIYRSWQFQKFKIRVNQVCQLETLKLWFAAQAADFVQLCGSQKVAWSGSAPFSLWRYAVLFGTWHSVIAPMW